MPKILERLVGQLKAKGKDDTSAWAIATSALQRSGNLKPGTQQATAKGTKRGLMSPAERAKDRESKRSNRPKSAYRYTAKTNRATLKKPKKRKKGGY